MFKTKSLFLIFFFLAAQSAFAQEVREESTLNYTYLGPVISASSNSAEYSDWNNNMRTTEKVSGTSFAGGADLKIIAGDLCGDFQMKYSYSQYDTTLTCLEFLMSGQYLYSFNSEYAAGGGFGFYLETPPSSQGHNGSSGFYVPVIFVYSTTQDTKLFVDLFAKYGSFGLGDNTKFISAGCSIGFVFKVGRI